MERLALAKDDDMIEAFAADRADQAFDEWMRQRRVRYRRDGLDVEDS